jgi:hypothetical protein
MLRPCSAPVGHRRRPARSIDVHVGYRDTDLRFFSVVSTIGTPVDVTAQELRVEAFFPADGATGERRLALGVP